MGKEETTLCSVCEVGMFGSLNMQDPTVNPINDLMERTNDPYLKEYLAENINKMNGGIR